MQTNSTRRPPTLAASTMSQDSPTMNVAMASAAKPQPRATDTSPSSSIVWIIAMPSEHVGVLPGRTSRPPSANLRRGRGGLHLAHVQEPPGRAQNLFAALPVCLGPVARQKRARLVDGGTRHLRPCAQNRDLG